MERNGTSWFTTYRTSYRESRSNINSRRTQTRQITTSRSKMSQVATLPRFQTNGVPKCASDGGYRRPANEVQSNFFQGRASSLPSQMNPFDRAAGLTTIDQSWMQKRGPFAENMRCNDVYRKRTKGNNAKRIFKRTSTGKPETAQFDGYSIDGNNNKSAGVKSEVSELLDVKRLESIGHRPSICTSYGERQRNKDRVILLSDASLKRMKEAENIYIKDNKAFHKQRLKKLEQNIGDQHRLQLERQLTQAEQDCKISYNKSLSSMGELKTVRQKFMKEKKKRVSSTYVSVAALETPEVDRYAYGLPEDGKEYTLVKKNSFVKASYKKKWDESVQKAKTIVNAFDIRGKLERTMTLPVLKPITPRLSRKIDVDSTMPIVEEDEKLSVQENTEYMSEPIKEPVPEEEKRAESMELETVAQIDTLVALWEGTSEVSFLQEKSSTYSDSDFEDI